MNENVVDLKTNGHVIKMYLLPFFSLKKMKIAKRLRKKKHENKTTVKEESLKETTNLKFWNKRIMELKGEYYMEEYNLI